MLPAGSTVIYSSVLVHCHIPGSAVPRGIGFSQNVASIKSLQIALIHILPHDSGGQDVLVTDYGMRFHGTDKDGLTHTSTSPPPPHELLRQDKRWVRWYAREEPCR